jgi:predicted NBD/HSP70 family sugar kinase
VKVLMIDVGGTNVKLMASGHEGYRKFPSGRSLTAAKMVKGVLTATEDWEYEAITLGFPGLVREGRITRNPLNLGGGWVDYDFKTLKKPVRIINDASMQALARYEEGRMLFVGLGTSVGAALIADDTIVPLEIGIMRLSKSEGFMDRLSKEALNTLGKARWQRAVNRAIAVLRDVFWPDHIALGGGNAKYLDPLPEGCDRGDNQDAFRGALRLWPGTDMLAEPLVTTWRIKRSPSPKKKGGK